MMIEDLTLRKVKRAKLAFGLCIAISCATLLTLPLYLPNIIDMMIKFNGGENGTMVAMEVEPQSNDSTPSAVDVSREYGVMREKRISINSIIGLVIGFTIIIVAIQLIALVSGMKELISLLLVYVLLSVLIMAYYSHKLLMIYPNMHFGARFLALWVLWWNAVATLAAINLIRLVIYKRRHYAFE